MKSLVTIWVVKISNILIHRVVNHVIHSVTNSLNYIRLKKRTIYLDEYSHFSLAKNTDNTSQVVNLILPADVNYNCDILNYSLQKSRRGIQSVLGRKLFHFQYFCTMHTQSSITLKQYRKNIFQTFCALKKSTWCHTKVPHKYRLICDLCTLQSSSIL